MHKLGMFLMLAAIGMMAFHIGYTAKTGSPDYFSSYRLAVDC